MKLFDRVRQGRVALAAAVLALALAAVGSASAAGERAPSAQQSGATSVAIHDFAFRPKTLTVSRGTRVTFANRDATAHTATRGGSFDSGRIRPGRAATIAFKRAGVYAYHCSIHSFMRGKVVVE